jgi:excinuclease ABC subunit C
MHRLAEVLRRRFARHDDTGWPMPDLLILDGGLPQLSVVLKNVPGLGEHVPVIALAKEHEDIYLPGRAKPINLPPDSAELKLLQSIRDEAHRFAIGYYRQKHRRESLRSILDDIPGLGAEGKKLLLDKYGTLATIHRATEQDLVQLLGKKRATAVRQQLGE